MKMYMNTIQVVLKIEAVQGIFVLYCIMETCILVFFTVKTICATFNYETTIKAYIHSIHDGLFSYDDSYIFPLNEKRVCDFTAFGKVLFIIGWILIFGMPFICNSILAFVILFVLCIIDRTCFK